VAEPRGGGGLLASAGGVLSEIPIQI